MPGSVRIFDLPLFPLNTVLFPKMPLSLHIFEERYKQMIGECLETKQPFGVVLIQEGTEALGPLAKPHMIGCTTRIHRVQRLEQGQMNIVTLGEERFRILSLDYSRPYLVGRVELFPFATRDADVVKDGGDRLRGWVERYLALLKKADTLKVEAAELPGDPLELAYLAAFLLQIPPLQKQALLELELADHLLAGVLGVYRREVTLFGATMSQATTDVAEPPSSN